MQDEQFQYGVYLDPLVVEAAIAKGRRLRSKACHDFLRKIWQGVTCTIPTALQFRAACKQG
jgi:hypothetical protein